MTAPRHWPCWKGWMAELPWAISPIWVNYEPPSGPRKRACWFSHAPMPRRKSACWPKCGRASRLRFRSYGTAFSTVCFRALGVACRTRSNSRSFTTTYGMPASSLNNELKTGVCLVLQLQLEKRRQRINRLRTREARRRSCPLLYYQLLAFPCLRSTTVGLIHAKLSLASGHGVSWLEALSRGRMRWSGYHPGESSQVHVPSGELRPQSRRYGRV